MAKVRLKSDKGAAARVAESLKAMAHPARLRIVATLCDGEQCVGGLAAMLGMRPAIVSQQLRILRMNGLVDSTRRQGFAVYRLAEPRIRTLVSCFEGCPARKGGGGRKGKGGL